MASFRNEQMLAVDTLERSGKNEFTTSQLDYEDLETI